MLDVRCSMFPRVHGKGVRRTNEGFVASVRNSATALKHLAQSGLNELMEHPRFVRADAKNLSVLHDQFDGVQARHVVKPASGNQPDAPAPPPAVAHWPAGFDFVEPEALANKADAELDSHVRLVHL